MRRQALISKYETMMFQFGEYDVWQDDIEPKLKNLTTKEIEKLYADDKKYYESREIAGGHW